MHEQIAQLQVAVAHLRREQNAPPALEELRPSQHTEQAARYRDELDSFDVVEEVLDDWNRGILSRTDTKGNTPGSALADIFSILPTRKLSTQVVDFALRYLSWIHCGLDPNSFSIRHEDFWNSMESSHTASVQGHEWLMLYFSVLAVRRAAIAMIVPSLTCDD